MIKEPVLENLLKKERNIELGKNVKLIISFIRHGDKTEKGELSILGYEEAKKLGKNKPVPKNGIKIITSPFRRTKDTGDAEMEGLEERDDLNILNQRKRINLAPPDWKHFDIIAKNAKEAEKIGGQPAMQRYVLSEPLAQNDLEKWTSALAYMIDRYRRGSHKLKAGSEYEIQHVTHDIVIADFLRKAVIFKNEKGERTNYDFNKEEAINYLEGFNLIIKLDENGEEDIKILFRGQEVDVDEKKLSELVHKYKENPHSGRMTNQDYKEKA